MGVAGRGWGGGGRLLLRTLCLTADHSAELSLEWHDGRHWLLQPVGSPTALTALHWMTTSGRKDKAANQTMLLICISIQVIVLHTTRFLHPPAPHMSSYIHPCPRRDHSYSGSPYQLDTRAEAALIKIQHRHVTIQWHITLHASQPSDHPATKPTATLCSQLHDIPSDSQAHLTVLFATPQLPRQPLPAGHAR